MQVSRERIGEKPPILHSTTDLALRCVFVSIHYTMKYVHPQRIYHIVSVKKRMKTQHEIIYCDLILDHQWQKDVLIIT